jgi:hypothetical protein
MIHAANLARQSSESIEIMAKSEIRRPKSERRPPKTGEATNPEATQISEFGFRPSAFRAGLRLGHLAAVICLVEKRNSCNEYAHRYGHQKPE